MEPSDAERATLWTVADYQFGPGAGAALFGDAGLRATRSRTGRLRQVYVTDEGEQEDEQGGDAPQSDQPGDGRLVSVGRDGRLTLGLAGGQRLVAELSAPRARVVVGDESEPFVRDGKNAFAKFVRDADPDVRARDEVAVVHERGALLAVGRAELDAESMRAFDTGMAVKVRSSAGARDEADRERTEQ